jgi:hypothetical protein
LSTLMFLKTNDNLVEKHFQDLNNWCLWSKLWGWQSQVLFVFEYVY